LVLEYVCAGGAWAQCAPFARLGFDFPSAGARRITMNCTFGNLVFFDPIDSNTEFALCLFVQRADRVDDFFVEVVTVKAMTFLPKKSSCNPETVLAFFGDCLLQEFATHICALENQCANLSSNQYARQWKKYSN
jgi:hypothetical protein